MIDRYSYKSFLHASEEERAVLCGSLAAHLVQRLPAVPTEETFHKRVYELIAELNDVGHGLYSFDESEDFQIWYRPSESTRSQGLTIDFRAEDFLVNEVCVDWMK